jgi:hypothetical protein
MLVSSILMNAQKKKMDESQKVKNNHNSLNTSMNASMSSGSVSVEDNSTVAENDKAPSTGALVFTLVIFLLEVAFLVYAIKLALACGKTTAQKALFVVLALMFPIPAVLVFWVTGCANEVD